MHFDSDSQQLRICKRPAAHAISSGPCRDRRSGRVAPLLGIAPSLSSWQASRTFGRATRYLQSGLAPIASGVQGLVHSSHLTCTSNTSTGPARQREDRQHKSSVLPVLVCNPGNGKKGVEQRREHAERSGRTGKDLFASAIRRRLANAGTMAPHCHTPAAAGC